MSLSEQLKRNEAAREGASSVEATALAQTQDALDGIAPREELEGSLRSLILSGYRSGASIGRQEAMQSSGLPGWEPEPLEALDHVEDLFEDVKRNLDSYERGDLTRRQMEIRVKYSVSYAVRRGRTEQTVDSYSELYDEGFNLKKYWVANFVNNTPCPACTRLHGTSVGIEEDFPIETGEPGVYRSLTGPPRHPNCRCSVFVHITNLGSPEEPNFETPEEPASTMDTDDVKRMPFSLFAAIKATLKAIISLFRRP